MNQRIFSFIKTTLQKVFQIKNNSTQPQMKNIEFIKKNNLSRPRRSLSNLKMRRESVSQDYNQIVLQKDQRSLDLKTRVRNLKLFKQETIEKQQKTKLKKSHSEACLPNIKPNNPNNFLLQNENKQIQPKSSLIQKFKMEFLTKQQGKLTLKPDNQGIKLKISLQDQKNKQKSLKVINQTIQNIQKGKNSTVYQQNPLSKSLNKLPNKSKSKGKLKKIYSKINNHYNRDQKLWFYHLQKQLSLEQAVEELQKIQLNRNLQPSRKLTMRQAYQLKKEIVHEIQKEETSSLIQTNIKKLAEIALDEKERDKFLMIGLFITLRQKLRNLSYQKQQSFNNNKAQWQPQFIFSKEASKQLKQEVQKWKPYKMLQANLINSKILSILTLHIMKLQSPIFSHEDINLINKTIELKIKVQTMIDYLPQDHKGQHFECLIYMIFQFYKILYYLKLDEDIKIHQYNLLQAYLSLYKEKNQLKYQLFQQNYGIQEKIKSLKPSAIGIYPYLDSRARNQINSLVLQREIDNNSKSNNNLIKSKKLKISTKNKNFQQKGNQSRRSNKQIQETQSESSQITQSSQSTVRQKSAFSIDQKAQQQKNVIFQSRKHSKGSPVKILQQPLSKQKVNAKIEISKITNKKTQTNLKLSIIKNPSQKILQKNMKKTQQNLSFINNSLNIDSFRFQFLLFKQERIYICQFIINVTSQTPKIVNLSIKAKDPRGFYLFIYRFEGIKTFMEDLNRQNFERIIWKIFRKIFVMKYMQEQNPFLMKQHTNDLGHVQKHLPQEISSYQFRVIEIMHQYIVYWLKKRDFTYTFNGKILQKPQFQLIDVNKYMENLQYEHDRKLFQKRQGYIDPLSGRRNNLNLLSNFQKNNTLVFNPIIGDFMVSPQNMGQSSKQIHIFLLIGVNKCENSQFKFIKLLFHKNLKEMSIFQIGFSKHLYSQVLNPKIKQIRKFKIYQNQSKSKLIRNLLTIINSQSNGVTLLKSLQKYNREEASFLFDNNKKYGIQQLFQIDLSNQFKFLPSLRKKFINQISINNQRQIYQKTPSFQQIYAHESKHLYTDSLIITLDHKVGGKRKSLKSNQNFCSFKISHTIFLTKQVKYPWGSRKLSLIKNLQFFTLKNMKQNQTYRLKNISLYKIGIFVEKEMSQVQHDGKFYNFYNLRKPFLSKLQKITQIQSNNSITDSKKLSQNEQLSHGPLHFIEEKVFFTLKYQRILKFKINTQIKYFSFQIYQSVIEINETIQENESNDDNVPKSQNLFIYQLTDFKNAHIKFYHLTDKQVTQKDQDKIKDLINIEQMSLMDEYMQKFTLPINKVTFRNQYNQFKVKNVRRKVISEANQYFKEKVFQSYQGKGKQAVLLTILQKFHSTQNTDEKSSYNVEIHG